MRLSSSNKVHSELSTTSIRILYPFPHNYEPVKVLGWGNYGEVLKSTKKDTKETVAIKVHYGDRETLVSYNNEVRDWQLQLHLMKFFKEIHLDKYHIVRFIDNFTTKDNRSALVFEMLDLTLEDYVSQRGFKPLCLHEVRNVIRQMATALDALKTIRVIHSDIKMDNIMLVNPQAQPLRLKLIDFGEAFPMCEAQLGDILQTSCYRAPEIFLGLPFSEAIDMWSLGVIMLALTFGMEILPKQHLPPDVMQWMVQLLGTPPDHLLDAGTKTQHVFNQSSGHWRLKVKRNHFKAEKLSLQKLLMAEVGERRECVDLLMAMLRMDPDERITPRQVLGHPFITRRTFSLTESFEFSMHQLLKTRTWVKAERGSEDYAVDKNCIGPRALSHRKLAPLNNTDTGPSQMEEKKQNYFKHFLLWIKSLCCREDS